MEEEGIGNLMIPVGAMVTLVLGILLGLIGFAIGLVVVVALSYGRKELPATLAISVVTGLIGVVIAMLLF